MKYGFELNEFNFQFFFGDVKSLRILAHADAASNLDLLLSLKLALQKTNEVKLFSAPIAQMGFQLGDIIDLSIGKVSTFCCLICSIGISFDLFGSVSFDIHGEAELTYGE
jgi:hypothetical protein